MVFFQDNIYLQIHLTYPQNVTLETILTVGPTNRCFFLLNLVKIGKTHQKLMYFFLFEIRLLLPPSSNFLISSCDKTAKKANQNLHRCQVK